MAKTADPFQMKPIPNVLGTHPDHSLTQLQALQPHIHMHTHTHIHTHKHTHSHTRTHILKEGGKEVERLIAS